MNKFIEELKEQPVFVQERFLDGVEGTEKEECRELQRRYYTEEIPQDVAHGDIVAGKITFEESGKSLYFGRSYAERWIVTKEGHRSLMVRKNKSGGHIFITPEKLSSFFFILWKKPRREVDYSEFL